MFSFSKFLSLFKNTQNDHTQHTMNEHNVSFSNEVNKNPFTDETAINAPLCHPIFKDIPGNIHHNDGNDGADPSISHFNDPFNDF